MAALQTSRADERFIFANFIDIVMLTNTLNRRRFLTWSAAAGLACGPFAKLAPLKAENAFGSGITSLLTGIGIRSFKILARVRALPISDISTVVSKFRTGGCNALVLGEYHGSRVGLVLPPLFDEFGRQGIRFGRVFAEGVEGDDKMTILSESDGALAAVRRYGKPIIMDMNRFMDTIRRVGAGGIIMTYTGSGHTSELWQQERVETVFEPLTEMGRRPMVVRITDDRLMLDLICTSAIMSSIDGIQPDYETIGRAIESATRFCQEVMVDGKGVPGYTVKQTEDRSHYEIEIHTSEIPGGVEFYSNLFCREANRAGALALLKHMEATLRGYLKTDNGVAFDVSGYYVVKHGKPGLNAYYGGGTGINLRVNRGNKPDGSETIEFILYDIAFDRQGKITTISMEKICDSLKSKELGSIFWRAH